MEAAYYDNIIEQQRIEPEFFRMGFYGRKFPFFLRNKEFVCRGYDYERLEDFQQRMLGEFPQAIAMQHPNQPDDTILQSDAQYLQIYAVTPVSDISDMPQLERVPERIKSFYRINNVSRFHYDRPFHKGPKDRDNEFRSLWIERTTLILSRPLPGISRWAEVERREVVEVSPIENAIYVVENKTQELRTLISQYQHRQHQGNINPLSMCLNGVIDAAVNGGIARYQEAFFDKDYISSHAEDTERITHLKDLMQEQVGSSSRLIRAEAAHAAAPHPAFASRAAAGSHPGSGAGRAREAGAPRDASPPQKARGPVSHDEDGVTPWSSRRGAIWSCRVSRNELPPRNPAVPQPHESRERPSHAQAQVSLLPSEQRSFLHKVSYSRPFCPFLSPLNLQGSIRHSSSSLSSHTSSEAGNLVIVTDGLMGEHPEEALHMQPSPSSSSLSSIRSNSSQIINSAPSSARGSPSLPDKAKHNREVMMLLPSHRERTSNSVYYSMGENGQNNHMQRALFQQVSPCKPCADPHTNLPEKVFSNAPSSWSLDGENREQVSYMPPSTGGVMMPPVPPRSFPPGHFLMHCDAYHPQNSDPPPALPVRSLRKSPLHPIPGSPTSPQSALGGSNSTLSGSASSGVSSLSESNFGGQYPEPGPIRNDALEPLPSHMWSPPDEYLSSPYLHIHYGGPEMDSVDQPPAMPTKPYLREGCIPEEELPPIPLPRRIFHSPHGHRDDQGKHAWEQCISEEHEETQ
ncbi:unnamed protein product [Tetraodon nigroviridis]|uniref:(spotted green pufferfish) hypothetical protein n=1 Tax=Tetraodon nigroviridis TaxID=99883 RepID=Q4RJZ5_TETNG|nr:unnamed protein product [Tetraodon nigroviridis]